MTDCELVFFFKKHTSLKGLPNCSILYTFASIPDEVNQYIHHKVLIISGLNDWHNH